MAKKKNLVPCFLYNNKDFKYPKGRMVTKLGEREELLNSGFNTGPADKAMAAREAKEEKEKKAADAAQKKADAEAKKAAEAAK